MDYFLNNICNDEWNLKQDAGRKIKEAEEELISKFPKYEDFPFDIWLGLFSMRSVCWNDLKPVEVSTRCIVTNKWKLKSN